MCGWVECVCVFSKLGGRVVYCGIRVFCGVGCGGGALGSFTLHFGLKYEQNSLLFNQNNGDDTPQNLLPSLKTPHHDDYETYSVFQILRHNFNFLNF